MKISIVIPNWNGADKLKNNLPKVLAVKGINEVIVSDDASTDNSVELLEKEFPQVKLVKREYNQGFSSNVNTGVRAATGDIIFLLNTDAVPAQDCLKYVIPHFQNENVFSVGCNVGGGWSWARFDKGYFWHYTTKVQGKARAHQTLWASGGSGVFRKDIWDLLGGLDTLFDPFYEEDVDLGYRATKRGYINIWEPEARVEHYKQKGVISENFSQSKINQIAQRNQLIFIWKNITSDKLIKEHQKALLKMIQQHPKYMRVVLSAVTHLPAVLQKRKVEKKEAKLSDEEILNLFTQNNSKS